METIFNIIAPFILAAGGLLGFSGQGIATQSTLVAMQNSVELGLYETSPRGEGGGFAIPASGCSAADPNWGNGTHPNAGCAPIGIPNISVNSPIIPYGESVTVTWEPNGNINCVLSANLGSLAVTVTGNRVVTLTGETSFSIVCNGAGKQDSVTVKVLPRIQET